MRNNINDSLNDVNRHAYKRYMGVLLEKHNGGYRMYENKSYWFASWELACAEIDKRQREMMELVRKQNPQ
jgi:hypothetical protein